MQDYTVFFFYDWKRQEVGFSTGKTYHHIDIRCATFLSWFCDSCYFSHTRHKVRLYLTNTREIHLSDRCYSSMDEYLPHVPDKVFVQSTSTCPIFFAEYIRPQYEYLPNDFEKVFVQETNSSLLLLRGCSSVAREYIALSQANTSLGNRCIICVTENKCSQKSHCCSNIRTLEFEYTSFMSNLCCSWVFSRVC